MSRQRRPARLLLLLACAAVGVWAIPVSLRAQPPDIESISPAPQPPVDDGDENARLVDEIGSSRVAKLIRRFTYAAIILVLFLCGMGLPLPEEIPILTSAVLAQAGHLDPWWALSACMFGVMSGDTIMYYLGRRWGTHLLDHRLSRKLLTPIRQRKIQRYFARHGARIIFAARFLPGIRAPIFLSAGTMGVSFWLFLAMDGGAAVLSIPLSFWLAYIFTDKLQQMLDVQHSVQTWLLVALAAGLIVWIIVHWRRARRKNGAASPADSCLAADRTMKQAEASSREAESAARD